MHFHMKSWQCFPTLKNDLIEKISESHADVLHLDLEDSIPESKKQDARESLKMILSHSFSKPTAIRINSLTSLYGINDLNFLRASNLPFNIVILPKVESNRDIEIVSHYLNSKANNIKIFAVIETLKGLKNIDAICLSNHDLTGLIFGAADISSEIGHGVHLSGKSLEFIRYEIAKTALTNNLMVIDSPCFEIKNKLKLQEESFLAKELGYCGKIAIHPDQVDTINTIFNYSEEEIKMAHHILKEIDITDKAISEINGNMIGPPFIKMAKKLLQKTNRE